MIFDVFEALLAALNSSGEDAFEGEWDDHVRTSLDKLSLYYGNQNLRNPARELIDYSGLPTQTAYIYMYAIGRAEFTYQLLRRFRRSIGAPLFRSSSINVTSIGGGPASELIGLIHYLRDTENGEEVTEILYDVVDKEPDWHGIVELLVDALPEGIEIIVRFYQADFAAHNGTKDINLEFDDLVFMSFFISEICELPNPKEVKDNIETILATMKVGSNLFYNDSNAFSFYSYMNNRARSIKGLTQLFEIEDMITFEYSNPGRTFISFANNYDKLPHLTSNAVSKIYERR